MASLNDLPLELVERIVDLSVESDILLRQQTSRRKILLNLSLVSKRFTLPAQNALWKRLEFSRFGWSVRSQPKVMSLIEEGFARTKATEYFDFLCINEVENDEMLWKIVNGVRQIYSLKLRGRLSIELDLGSLFLLPSLQNLLILDLTDFKFDTTTAVFPSTIQELHLTSTDSNSRQLSSIFEALKDLPNTYISVKQSGNLYGSGRLENYDLLSNCLQLHGYKIRKYEISHSTKEFNKSTMPYLHSLCSLTIQHTERFQRQLAVISLLPPTVPLEVLELSIPSLEDYYVNFLLPLLRSPQLEGLKELYNLLHSHHASGERYERGGTARVKIVDSLREEMDRSVELCRDRGIALHFSSHVNVLKYKVKRGMYILEWGR